MHNYTKLKQTPSFFPTIFQTYSMASHFSLTIFSLSLLFFFSFSYAKHHHHHHHHHHLSPEIRAACKVSRDPSKCETSFHHLPPNLTTLQIIHSALGLSYEKLTKAHAMVNDLVKASEGNMNLTLYAENCKEGLDFSGYRFKQTDEGLTNGKIKDARAWMSAALGYQHGCSSGLQKVNDTSLVRKTIILVDSLIGFTSNTLGMIMNYDIHGNQTRSWNQAKTERDGFWEGVTSPTMDVKGGVPSSLKPDVTVCKAGNCDYSKVQDAVNAAPNNLVSQKFVIWIKAGLYDEIVRVPLQKRNLVFLGDGMGKTVITGSLNVGHMANSGMTTFESATVGVLGDGFMARGLTIQNTAGADAQQAVAFRSSSDLSVIENCEFLGNQDTLYLNSLRQYYKSCRIQGNIDFIFGNAAAFFQDCEILVSPRVVNPESGETNAVTAHGRIEPVQSTGFVFYNCSINGTDEYMKLYYRNPSVHKTFLGRPWKEYSRTVFIQCTLGDLINPAGWMPWSGEFALNTLYYGEFKNYGAAADTKQRVLWSSQIPDEHVYSYSVQNFIQGDQWISSSS